MGARQVTSFAAQDHPAPTTLPLSSRRGEHLETPGASSTPGGFDLAPPRSARADERASQHPRARHERASTETSSSVHVVAVNVVTAQSAQDDEHEAAPPRCPTWRPSSTSRGRPARRAEGVGGIPSRPPRGRPPRHSEFSHTGIWQVGGHRCSGWNGASGPVCSAGKSARGCSGPGSVRCSLLTAEDHRGDLARAEVVTLHAGKV